MPNTTTFGEPIVKTSLDGTEHFRGATPGGNFQIASINMGLSPVAGADLNFYVATTGSDSNPGTSGSPFATIQRAVNVAAQYDYQNTYRPFINVAAGTYTLTNFINLPELIHPSASPGRIVGAGALLTILFDSVGNGCVFAGGGAVNWSIGAVQFDTNNFAVYADHGAWIRITPGLPISVNNSRGGALPQWFVAIDGGIIQQSTDVTVLAAFSTYAQFGGRTPAVIDIDFGTTITLPASPMAGGYAWFNNFNGYGYAYFYASVVNPSSFQGAQLHIGSGSPSLLLTSDGTLNSIPGIAANNAFDATCIISNITTDATNYFYTPVAGPPTTTQLPNPQSWSVFKNTVGGPVALVSNDGGKIVTVASDQAVSTYNHAAFGGI